MSILLLCPPPAEVAPQVGEHQIVSLVAATAAVLTQQGIAYSQQYFSLDANDQNSELRNLKPDSTCELMIFVGYPRLSVSDQLQNVALSMECPLIHIKPRFPGVLIRNDIELTGCTQHGHRLTPTETNPSTPQIALPEAYHYSQFAPISQSAKFTNDVPTKTGIDALVVLRIDEQGKHYNQQHDLETILAALPRLGSLDSVSLLLEQSRSEKKACDKAQEAIMHSLAESIKGHIDARVRTCTVSHRASHLIPFFRSFDIALFGGSTHYADAIELGIPVYAWRQSESTTLLNDLLDVSATGKPTYQLKQLKTHINELQLELINEMTARHHALTIPNTMGRFYNALNKLLTDVVAIEGSVKSIAIDPAFERQPIIPPTDTIYPGSELHASRHTLQHMQRKLLKFRQSPTRFIRDSNSPLARHLHPLLPQTKS